MMRLKCYNCYTSVIRELFPAAALHHTTNLVVKETSNAGFTILPMETAGDPTVQYTPGTSSYEPTLSFMLPAAAENDAMRILRVNQKGKVAAGR